MHAWTQTRLACHSSLPSERCAHTLPGHKSRFIHQTTHTETKRLRHPGGPEHPGGIRYIAGVELFEGPSVPTEFPPPP